MVEVMVELNRDNVLSMQMEADLVVAECKLRDQCRR